MQVNSALNSAMLGYQRANNSLENAAQNVAVATTASASPTNSSVDALASEPSASDAVVRNNIDLNSELVSMNTALYNGTASIKVLDTADEVLGTSIDVSV